MKNKKAAIELSIGTIVIIVLGVTMLILGMVLVRSVMCSAISLTTDVGDKAQSELNTYFGDSGTEIACIGAGGEPIKMVAGKTNAVYCIIKASSTAKYEAKITGITSSLPSLTKEKIQSWIVPPSFSGQVSPGDTKVRKIIRLNIPKDAPEATIVFSVEIYRDGAVVDTEDLDFQISRTGFVKNSIC